MYLFNERAKIENRRGYHVASIMYAGFYYLSKYSKNKINRDFLNSHNRLVLNCNNMIFIMVNKDAADYVLVELFFTRVRFYRQCGHHPQPKPPTTIIY